MTLRTVPKSSRVRKRAPKPKRSTDEDEDDERDDMVCGGQYEPEDKK